MTTDQIKIADLIQKLGKAFPDRELKQDVIDLYVEHLSGQDLGMIEAAKNHHIRSGKWFPKIAELLEYIRENSPNALPVAETAWLEVMSEIRRVGSYGQPVFKNDITAQTVRSLGWGRICTEGDIEWHRKNFIETYNIYAQQQEQRERFDEARQLGDGKRKLLK